MPRANRHWLPGHVWHITHRCHRQQFLLKFLRDRRLWRRWLFEAVRRFDLCVLDFIVTSNHVHLLVRDRGHGEIAKSMQLIAGRTAQAYNRRKRRKGAYWEDRYHATAVEANGHLAHCIAYIDLNMVRAGVVSHPKEWAVSGYREIQASPARCRVIDYAALMSLFGVSDLEMFQSAHRGWIEEALNAVDSVRDGRWSRSLAVGSRSFVEQFQADLGVSAAHRRVDECDGGHVLRDAAGPYAVNSDPEIADASPENAVSLYESA